MMYADLVDLEDLITALNGLGAEVPPQAGIDEVEQRLRCWLAGTSPAQKQAYQRVAGQLCQSEVLPEVASLIRRSLFILNA